MCEQTEISYLDGEVVWVKLGSCWWPGEVVGPEKLPPDVLPSFRKPPIAVVKFFQEDAYEYVKNLNSIYKYNCSRKTEFINKGLYMYRTKHGHMEKFPEDVIRAEAAVGGDITILTRDEFQETKKESYANLFGDPAKRTPISNKKGRGRGRSSESYRVHSPTRKINVDKPNYKVHILLQGSQTGVSQSISKETETTSTPSTSRADSEPTEEIKTNAEQPVSTPPSTPKLSASGIYSCHACPFTTTRLNVLILHTKTHSVTFMPYTPSPVRKKNTPMLKSSSKPIKSSKSRKTMPEKTDKTPIISVGVKRVAEDKPINEVKKTKTDEEIKISLLADWDIDEDSNDESSVMVMAGSPEVAAPAESPTVAVAAELPEAQVPLDLPTPIPKSPEDCPVIEKPETSSDSKYEFCEDEDWPEEADVGRKIPRVKNPKPKEDNKSMSLDDDEVAKEVAELLNKTTVPELPSAPEPLKIEENFPEPSIVKSPDKKADSLMETSKSPENKSNIDSQPSKTIFKTKTFFRSRHSRSQDAIGKYVAEQLNAERVDMSEEINGSELLPTETRISPPPEPVKVARLAPKIQLKKMKAEAAQMREKDKMPTDVFKEDFFTNCSAMPSLITSSAIPENQDVKDNLSKIDETHNNENILDEVNINSQNDITQIDLDHLSKTDEMITQIQECSSMACDTKHDNYERESECEPELQDTQSNKNTLDSEVDSPSNDNECQQNNENSIENEIVETPHKEILEITQNDSEFNEKQSITFQDFSSETEVGGMQTIPNEEIADQDCAKSNEEIQEEEESKKDFTKVDDMEYSDIAKEKCEKPKEKCEKPKEIDTLNVTEIGVSPQSSQQGSSEHATGPFMNESTASAVDALLSVSRDTDRVTKNISNDLPEDLFEDDNKDNFSPKNINGYGESNDKDINLNGQEDTETETKAYEDKSVDMLHEEPIEVINKDEHNVDKHEVTSEKMENLKVDDSSLKEMPIVVTDSSPSESDLVIAETLINLPSTTIQNKPGPEHEEIINSVSKQLQEDTFLLNNEAVLMDNKTDIQNIYEINTQSIVEIPPNHITKTDNVSSLFQSEEEKCENLNAAQSLVQMSESIEHKINVNEIKISNKNEKTKPITFKPVKDHEAIITKTLLERKSPISVEKNSEGLNCITVPFESGSPKLLKILEEPSPSKTNLLTKQMVVTGKEKILNFDVAKTGMSNKSHSPKQKIIIRRSNTPHKNLLNNVTEVTTPDKIILSRSVNKPQDGSSVQTYTIKTATEAPSDPNTIVIQQKVRKVTKTHSKPQKLKPHAQLASSAEATKVINDTQGKEDPIFDINSMPIVLSDEILTPESIEKMPIVMSDGNIISNTSTPQKIVKPKATIIEKEKIAITPSPQNPPKQEFKTLFMNPVNEVSKVTTPNILSKSPKLRGTKMLLIDKTSGKQKIIMTKQTPQPEPIVKEIKPQPSLIQSIPQNPGKTEKFILVPTTASPRQGRTQKIVIDPQTGKAQMLYAKNTEPALHVSENKPVSAKLVPSATEATTHGNTVMIITNAQGTQSRIVLKPEHEKILFPNKQQPNVSQLKTITHRLTPNPASANKSVVTTVASTKNPTRVVQKPKSAIITSKGQLIVGGRVTNTTQNIAPMPEIRQVPKRILPSEPKKIVQTVHTVQAVQKNSSEPLIFFQQKSGAMMQLTAAQFEHLQRTGQIIQKTTAPPRENKIVLQKTINISPNETIVSNIKPRARKQAVETHTPIKKIKQDIPIAPAPTPMPALCPISSTVAPAIIAPNPTTPSTSAPVYSNLDNFEELLPSTAIARQAETTAPQPEQPAPATLSDGQLLAIPGEHFGGPPGSFYLCVEDNGTFTPIDNRPLVLENNQLVPMPEPVPVIAQAQPERRDILEAALANSDVFHGESAHDDAPDFRDLNANVSVHCRVSETSTTLNQPIMTPVEVPTKVDVEATMPANLEDGLAVIGVTPPTVPTSLELPITVTDPRIALKTTDPLSSNNYGTALLPSPRAEMSYISTEEVDVPLGGPISMPLLTEEEPVGKSMPILTDDVPDRMSSVETVGSPSSTDVRDSETDDSSQWPRRLLTSGSDTSGHSVEIPLQQQIKLSVSDIK